MHDLVVDLIAVAVCGALGGFANVFIGDSGLHLPTIEQGSFALGISVLCLSDSAAVGAWLSYAGSVLTGNLVPSPTGNVAAL